jgi:hypothetical protein
VSARVKQDSAVVESPAASALRLRPLRDEDEAAFTAGHRAMAAEGFTFGLGYEPGKPWATYLKEQEDHRHGRNLPVAVGGVMGLHARASAAAKSSSPGLIYHPPSGGFRRRHPWG